MAKMTSTILIIGSTGQIGSAVEDHFRRRQYKILTLNRINKATLPFLLSADYNSEHLLLDSLNSNRFADLIKRFSISHIVHCASPRGSLKILESENIESLRFINYDVTAYFLDSLLKTELQTSFTFMASSAMYTPEASITTIDESTEFNPSSSYGLVKSQTVKLIDEFRKSKHLSAHSLILFNQESPSRAEGFLFRDLAKSLSLYSQGQISSLVVQDKHYAMDWSDARDLPSLLELCFNKQSFENYVAASGRLQTIEALLMETCGLMELEITEKQILSSTTFNSTHMHLMGNPKKALDLGWQGSRKASLTLAEFALQLKSENSD